MDYAAPWRSTVGRTNSTMKMTKRLLRLEARFGSLAEPMRRGDVPSAAELIAERLARFGIVRGPNESLAETTARAMGVVATDIAN